MLALAVSGAMAAGQQLQFLTHELPPLNYRDGASVTGLCTELVRELQRRSGVGGEIELMPWARAVAMAANTPNVALFFTTRTAEREAQYQWIGPIVNVSSSVYMRAGARLNVERIGDLAAVKQIIVHRGSFLEQALRRLGLQRLTLANTPEDALRLLLLQDLDDAVMVLTDPVVPAAGKKLRVPLDALKPVLVVHKGQGYLALSKGTAPDTAALLQKELDAMKRDGTFAAIYAKWLPQAAAPGLLPEPALDLLQPSP
ncbi:substrate-binding periplasmic protein [Paucibacter soli]|uniref:substrate-binding periplasmic protein n=1 Tax=Paucibacter soli TaxID=3133433 RepID=UPI0030A2E407